MPRKIGQDWEPSIPLTVVDIHLRGIEALLAALQCELIAADCVPARVLLITESRTRFLRELTDELKAKTTRQHDDER